MRHFSILATVAALFFTAISIAFPARGAEAVTLVIWGEPGTTSCLNDPKMNWEFCNYARLLNDRWAEQHPDIKLIWEDHGWDEALYKNLVAAIEAGKAPDITVGEAFMPALAQGGKLVPLTLPESVRANLIPATVRGATIGDTLYGVAAFTAVFTLEVNVDVVRAAGLNPDTIDFSSWDGVSDAAQKITKVGKGEFYGFAILGPTANPAAAMFRAAPYLYQAQADFCNMPACDKPTFNDPKAIPVYEWFRKLYKASPPDLAFNGDEGYVFSQLFSGQTAMQTAGSWHPNWAKGSGCDDCRYYPLPLPAGGRRANVVVGNAIYATLAGTKYPKEAAMFLEWLVSDEVQTVILWTGIGGRMPTTIPGVQKIGQVMGGDTSSVPAFYTKQMNKRLSDAPAEALLYAVYIDELLSGDVRILPPWASKSAELNTLWNEMFVQILKSDAPVQKVMDEYQAKAEALIAGK